MGNKLSCSCAPLIKKAYRYEDTPFQQQRRRDGHLLRLWAEVFHVSAASGAVRWQQVSEDLVPVNITCIQDTPECIFHITAYNSQVEKILDVRLMQPGTRLGQASECFVYWKDIATGDTWGLNFTSPLDAKQFRELCSPSFKFSRKASSSYSLRLNEPPSKKTGPEKAATVVAAKRKPQSTPSSPSRRGYGAEELQCTCMAAETLHRQRNGRVRYTASATLPRSALRQDSTQSAYITAYPSTTSVNAAGQRATQVQGRGQGQVQVQGQGQGPGQGQGARASAQQQQHAQAQAQAAVNYRNAQYSRSQYAQSQRKEQAKSMDSTLYQYKQQAPGAGGAGPREGAGQTSLGQGQGQGQPPKGAGLPAVDPRSRSKSSDDVRRTVATGTEDLQLDSNTLKKMLHPLAGQSSPGDDGAPKTLTTGTNTTTTNSTTTAGSRRESMRSLTRPTSVPSWSYYSGEHRSSSCGVDRSRIYRSEVGRRRSLERSACIDYTDQSPPSDHYLSDTVNRCYATTPTPSSSGDEGPPLGRKASSSHQLSVAGQGQERLRPSSPTIKILQEYEQHLRNALAKGNEADTYSLNTFETLLSQSMENVVALMKEVQSELDAIRREEQHFRPGDEAVYQPRSGRPQWARSYTLPSRGTSLPPSGFQGSSTSDLYTAIRKSSAPILDSLSIDGGLPFGATLHPQASFESTDSRAYLTSSEMSDDERLSLTTAISDDDDGETRDSPYRAKSGAAAAAFQCTGAVRKAGFLSVKKWLLRKRHQIELARKRGWKGYWVCLKGTTLLFYPCDSRDGRAIESTPRHLIIIDGAIMQPIPEHPKRDFIFCLSTAFGDAYLFQAPCQIELDNWISAIHNSCGAAFARHRGKTGTLHLLTDEIHRMDKQLDSDGKLKHMAELQLTVVADMESRKQLQEQIRGYEETLEQCHCEQFRLRCYMASLQGSELPNPKTLLAHVAKPTKSILNRLGVFTVSSFHAYICARSPSMLTNIISGRGSSRRRSTNSAGGACGTSSSTRSLSRTGSMGSRQGSVALSRSAELPGEKMIQLIVPPDDMVQSIYVRGLETVDELLWSTLTDKQLSPNDYFLRLKTVNGDYYIPSRYETVDHFPVHDEIEVHPKVLYQVELSRLSLEQLFGFSVEAELVENSSDHHNQDELCVYVSRVEEASLASDQGLAKGDEIMVINGAIVSDLDMMYIESVLQEEQSLCMMLRSCRSEPPEMASAVRSTDEYIESLVCPPPPSDGIISDEMIGKLIVPSPLWSAVQERNRTNVPSASGPVGPSMISMAPPAISVSGEQIAETLLKSAEQVTSEYCRLSTAQTAHPCLQPQHLSHQQPTQPPLQPLQPQPQPVQPQSQHHQQLHQTQLQIHTAPAIGGAVHHHPQPQPQLMHQQSVDEEGHFTKRPPLSDAEKLRKVTRELVDTEKTYVEHLNSLLEIYLEPMKKQSLLSNADISTLFGNIQEIVSFQRVFLESLEEAVNNEGRAFEGFSEPSQFRAVLYSLGNSFLCYADKFKLYSSFCASHSKAQKILHPSNEAQNPGLTEFLNSRSRGQHAYSLESYLIKPIQRILKYPLLLQQLKHLTDTNSGEHKHLASALKGMERVAEHINEMQRIHEEYGAIFDHLQRQHLKSSKALIELSPVELLYYGGIEWLNISEFLGKIKKGLDLHAMCFVFKQAVVFLCKERIRQKKKLVGVSSKLSEVEIIRYQVLIPVTEVQVRATSVRSDLNTASGSEQASSSSHFLWELIHLRCTQITGGTQRRSEKVYQVSNSTNEFRNAFLRTIRQIIRESVRNMAVPSTKPSLMSKQPIFHQSTASSPSAGQTVTTASSASSQPQFPHLAHPPLTSSLTSGQQQQSQSSSSQSAPGKSSGEKPPLKQKPLPPPRAPTTAKSCPGPSGSHTLPHHSHQHTHSKQTVSCGLCGADVGLGPGEAKSSMRSSPAPETDRSEHSSSSGKAKLIQSTRGSKELKKMPEQEDSQDAEEEEEEEEDPNAASNIWKPRDTSR